MVQHRDLDLLSIDCGAITAPAGCGKTHLIAEALSRHQQEKPVLVLTHTNAGVAALRNRLTRAGVPSRAYSLITIDGWAMRLAACFPVRSNLDHRVLNLTQPQTDYPAIRRAAQVLLGAGHISEILKASYSRLIVDEYQDCSMPQHAIICEVAKVVPACVLGDPLQAIFGFNGNALVDWTKHVSKHFPTAGELKTPWRWQRVGAQPLGQWLLDVRNNLSRGIPIDLQSAPEQVTWVKLENRSDFKTMMAAARTPSPTKDGSVLIIGDSIKSQERHRIARAVPGAVVVERVDLTDLVSFSQKFDLSSNKSLEKLLEFAQDTMANVGADLCQRVDLIIKGQARKPPSDAEKIAVTYVRKPSYAKAAELLAEIWKEPGVRAFRPTVVSACLRALQLCAGSETLSFHEAVIRIREQNRALGRPLAKRSIGSTLLLKGLEAESAVILNADALDANNLYVAMTRGSMRLTICSSKPHLNPVVT